LNKRYEYGFDEEILFMLVDKINIPNPEKKLSQMSAEELQALSKSFFSERKIEFISKLKPEQINIIDRLEYELVVVDLM
jgi:hypothetical protein